jgi:pimeloyl-ACP methyl ester carboxylesterase
VPDTTRFVTVRASSRAAPPRRAAADRKAPPPDPGIIRAVAMRQPLFEHRMELAGRETRALELLGDGPPILLVHGLHGLRDTWRKTLATLARAGRAALAIDLPGFGQASRLDRDGPICPAGRGGRRGDRAPRRAARRRGRRGRQLARRGCLALRAAERDDLRSPGIVPVAPAGFDTHVVPGDRGRRARAHGARRPLPERVVRAFMGQAYRQLAFARPRAIEAAVVNAFVGHHASQRDLRRGLATGRRLMPELKRPFDLTRIDVPVLLVWGERDRMVTHKGSRHLVAALPRAGVRAAAGLRPLPAARGARALRQLLEAFASARLAA